MSFSPIAIVGRACVLPGALSPEALWAAVSTGQDLISSAPSGRWGLDPARVTTTADRPLPDHAWSDRGGYVSGFDQLWDPSGFALPADALAGLDPLFAWVLHTGRAALLDAGLDPQAVGPRTTVTLGNLSFPTRTMADLAETTWLKQALGPERMAGVASPDPRNRFMSGLPSLLLARALGLQAGAFSLDAACASGLYAIKLACDRLQDGRADVALAGAVNRADDLFIHVGFCALQAMSKTGRSRPFHAGADGLVPAEGAAFVVLKRLEDALEDGNPIHGVIRGVGLSNDGRGRGLLAPSAAGQERAIRAAWAQAELEPGELGLLECHATGTPVGDATELRSTAAAFGERARGLPLGSLKSNLGHLVTVAGVAGLIKATEALRHRIRPPTLHVDEANPALAELGFRPVRAAEPWSGPLRAAVSAFGFGGNNAHLVVDADGGDLPPCDSPRRRATVAVIGMATQLGAVAGNEALASILKEGAPIDPTAPDGSVALMGLRFPPTDLRHTLAQQTLVLELARRATGDVAPAAPHRSGVVVGMGCDPEIARYGARWRLSTWAERLGLPLAWAEAAQDAFAGPLSAAGVVGTMPNIPANRINRQLDLGGPGFTVSAEEGSGAVALELGLRALQAGELDAVIVGAVDLCVEPVHAAAARALLPPERHSPADAAVVLVLKREADALADGDPILARLIDPVDLCTAAALPPAASAPPARPVPLGHAHAACALVDLAGALIQLGQPDAPPSLDLRRAGMADSAYALTLHRGSPRATLPADGPRPGPQQTSPAHLPVIALPAPVRAPKTPPGAPMSEVMTPAPRLPSAAVSAALSVEPPRAPAPIAAPVYAAPQGAPPAVEVLHVADPLAVVAQAHQLWLGQLSDLHQGYLSDQARLHRNFLDLRQRGAAILLESADQAPVFLDLPAAPVAAPAPAPSPAPAPAPAPSRPAPLPRSAPAPEPLARPQPPVSTAARKGPPPPKGMTLDRAGLLVHASGNISEIFGPQFKAQDGWARVTRMPEPPLLLADRMTGLDAEPCSMGKGSIWTETDVTWDAWYLHQGRMPAGLMIESGQADLMLISYLGVNLLAGPDRLYRLLGCKLTYHGDLPQPGETLRYDIHVDGHAKQGDIRLFFFHYDCYVGDELRLSVRGGQAGFFTEEELSDSAGIIWTPESQEIVADARLDAPVATCPHRVFDADQMKAFAEGRPWEAFGADWEMTKTHHRTPGIQSGRHLYFHRVPEFSPRGGPWGRGYLRAERDITAGDWFFQGHFKNDPCMPGTLMFEGCMQAMAFAMAAMGFTIDRDGWRFQPVPDQCFDMRCRGQTIPSSKLLVYEIFIEEVVAGPIPTVYADLLCTTDGLKGFHARRVGLQLVPDWPLTTLPDVIAAAEAHPVPASSTGQIARHGDFAFDYRSLLCCAWGRPSEAFGPLYAPFDSPRRVARLPGPPYHFMSRVAEVGKPMGTLGQGHRVVVEYDIPEKCWYFDENDTATMPFCVLLEAALQPCGWLASYAGCTLATDQDLLFRNLDGTGTLHRELRPGDGTLRTEASLDRIARTGGMTILAFTVRCTLNGEAVYDLSTVFGFFPPASMANQVGLAVGDADREFHDRPSRFREDLDSAAFTEGAPKLPPVARLRVLERLTGFWPDAGAAGLGQIRGEMDVDAAAWFFKAHFFSDPVQPGSLGVEAMLRLLQAWCVKTGLGADLDHARFEPLLTGLPHSWSYRGQVVPTNHKVVVTAEITEVVQEEGAVRVLASSSLWVDGKRIYSVPDLGMRVVAGGPETPDGTLVLDPKKDSWVADHCPTWTLPALPMTSMLDLLSQAVPGPIRGLRSLRIKRWLVVDGPVTLRVAVGEPTPAGVPARLLLLEGENEVEVASATVLPGQSGEPPAPLSAARGSVQPDPYAAGHLFHGPAFQVLQQLILGEGQSSATLSADPGPVPLGRLNPRLLDGATHAIPHDQLWRWTNKVGRDEVAYPAFLPQMDLYGPTPTSGTVRCEVRFGGMMGEGLPIFDLQLIHEERVWAAFRLVEATFPKGAIGQAPPMQRRAFLRDRVYVPGLGLSQHAGGQTTLQVADVAASDWLPGTLAAVYGRADPEDICLKDHLAAEEQLHPGILPEALPMSRHIVSVLQADGVVTARSIAPRAINLDRVEAYWSRRFNRAPWPVEDLYYGLIERFVGRVVLEDPAAFDAVRGRSLVFLGNHQTGIESLIFSILAGGLTELPCVTVAKDEHRGTWLGDLIRHSFAFPGVTDPEVITYFDRDDKESLMRIIGGLARDMVSPGRSVMVHVEGTRSLSCRKPVEKMSGAFIDMALAVGAPIVPVRFVGGLPVAPLAERTEFPVGLGRQDIWFGRPIDAAELAGLPYGERKRRVIAGINRLGPDASVEEPLPAEPEWVDAVARHVAQTGVREEHAVLLEVLRNATPRCEATRRLVEAAETGHLALDDSEEDAWLGGLGRWLLGPKAVNESMPDED